MVDVPFISPLNVRAALDALVYQTTQKSYDALLRLACVDLYLIEQRVARATIERDYALKQILLDLLYKKYEQAREVVSLPTNLQCSTHQAVAQRLQEDTTTVVGIPRRRALGVLFARYYCAELDISLEQISNWTSTDKRTVRRALETAVNELTTALVELETQALGYVLTQSLRHRLPALPDVRIRRDDLLRPIQQLYQRRQHGVVLLTGSVGVGKTYLASLFWRGLIEQGTEYLDDIIWVSDMSDSQGILSQIHDSLSTDDSRLTLLDHLSLKQIGVVLDVRHEPDDLHIVVETLAPVAFVMCMVRTPSKVLVDLADVMIEIGPFSLDQTMTFATRLRTQDYFTRVSDDSLDFETLYTKTGGNPQRIKQMLRLQSWNRVLREPVDWAMWIERQPVIEQRAFLEAACLSVTKSTSVALERLSANARDVVQGDATAFFEAALQWATTAETGMRMMEEIIREMAAGLWGDMSELLAVVPVLMSRLRSDVSLASAVLRTFWRDGMAMGQVRYWHYLLADIGADSELQLARCAVLSRLGGYEAAFDTQLRAVLQMTGERGHFDVQAEALYIGARHLQRRGALSRSLHLLESLANNVYASEDLKRRVRLAMFRVHIDAGMFERAEHILGELPRGEREIETCWVELLFVKGKYQASLALAQSFVGHRQSATLYALMAQSAAKLGQSEDAYNWFAHALQSESGDRLTLARVANNFAATLIEAGNTMGAEHLLNWTLQQQTELRDTVGLLYTRHNLGLLRRLI